jgi:hypothetical protein
MANVRYLPTALKMQMNDANELRIYGDLRDDPTEHTIAALRVPSTWDDQRLQMRPKKSAYDQHPPLLGTISLTFDLQGPRRSSGDI